MANYKIVFSPTGGTQKVTDILAENIHDTWKLIDLSTSIEKMQLQADDICIVAVPSFGGRVPATAIKRLEQINGNGTKAILVCVYGNRAFEDTLVELQDTLVQCGFTCTAAVAAIAEHSIIREFAANRPDKDDYAVLAEFAKEIIPYLKKDATECKLTLPGNHPYKEFKGSAMKPTVSDACSGCGICAAKCPTAAIDPENPATTNIDACISCMRCVAICPSKARVLDSNMLASTFERMKAVCSDRKENELFLHIF